MMRRTIFLFLLAILLLTIDLPESTAQAPVVGEFITSDCLFELPEDAIVGRNILCGYIFVPEYHDRATDNTIRLPIAILPSQSANPAPDPLFMAQGGPGGSTLSYFVPALTGTELGAEFLAQRDVILVEQRGTRYAQPNLGCDELQLVTYNTLMLNLDAATTDELTVAALAACHTRLTADGIDLSAYDSIQNAHDMNMVRLALGYDQINFYGVSYGTMLVQHYMRLYPDTLRSTVMDAVVPLERNFLLYFPANAQRVFDLVFAECLREAVCPYMYPDLESEFYATVANLNANPVTLELYDSNTDTYYEGLFTGDNFMSLMFNILYITEFIPFVPSIMWGVINGDYDIVTFLHAFYTFNFTLSRGMYYSVLCAEDADFTLDEVVLDGVQDSVAANFRLDRFEPICTLWDVDELGDAADAPVYSDVPTLILSGEYDPITPPENGKILAQTLTNAYVLTFPAVGHGVFGLDCGNRIMLQFLDQPTVAPEVSCMNELRMVFTAP